MPGAAAKCPGLGGPHQAGWCDHGDGMTAGRQRLDDAQRDHGQQAEDEQICGTRKMAPASLTPRRFTSVTTIRIARHRASVCFSSEGMAEIRAPTPAEMPTAAVRT